MLFHKRVIPRRGYVLLAQALEDERTPGGVILTPQGRHVSPEDVEAASPHRIAIVLALGPEPMSDSGACFPTDGLKAGDHVVYRMGFGGLPVMIDGEPLILAPYGSIVGIVEQLTDEEIVQAQLEREARQGKTRLVAVPANGEDEDD
jgi:co-chaperonin GroES (HSP10)